MAIKHRSATLAGLRELDDPVVLRLAAATEVLGADDLPALAGRLEIETGDGATLAGELVPTAETYGWDWEGVLRNVARMEPEMAVDRDALDELQQVVRELSELDSVAPVVAPTIARLRS
jgi:hypothetical protein